MVSGVREQFYMTAYYLEHLALACFNYSENGVVILTIRCGGDEL